MILSDRQNGNIKGGYNMGGTISGIVYSVTDPEFGNSGQIERVYNYPYKGAARKEVAYKVTCMADYNGGFIYRVSVFETLEEAKKDLKHCGFFDVND